MFESQAASQRKSPLPLDGKTVLKSGEATCQVCRVSTLHERLNFPITTYCCVQDASKDFFSSKHAAGDLIVEVLFLCVSPRLSFHHQLLDFGPWKPSNHSKEVPSNSMDDVHKLYVKYLAKKEGHVPYYSVASLPSLRSSH